MKCRNSMIVAPMNSWHLWLSAPDQADKILALMGEVITRSLPLLRSLLQLIDAGNKE